MGKYEIDACWSEENSLYLAEVPDLPGCLADGKTRAEAIQNAEFSSECGSHCCRMDSHRASLRQTHPRTQPPLCGSLKASREHPAVRCLLERKVTPAMKKLASNRFILFLSAGLVLGGAAGFGWSWWKNLQPHVYDPISDGEWNALTAIFCGTVGTVIGLVLAVLVRGISRLKKINGHT
jgi:hypothetical protein